MKQIVLDKLAEEYAQGKGHEHYHFLFEENTGNPSDFAKLCYIDGYQDGLNADRWNYPSKGEYPLYEELVLCKTKGGSYLVGSVDKDKKEWVFDHENFAYIDRWQYIVPPKEEA